MIKYKFIFIRYIKTKTRMYYFTKYDKLIKLEEFWWFLVEKKKFWWISVDFRWSLVELKRHLV